MPIRYAYNQPGMQAAEPMSPEDAAEAERIILEMRDACLTGVAALAKLGPINPKNGEPLGLHKQWANRYIEPWQWHTIVVTSVNWDNFFEQRCSELAQPEIEAAAVALRDALKESTPKLVKVGEWHLPYLSDAERKELALLPEIQRKVSAARCARVSYLTQQGKRDIQEDVRLYDRLTTAQPPHWSPLEHVATPYVAYQHGDHKGNLPGWIQLRHYRTESQSTQRKGNHMTSSLSTRVRSGSAPAPRVVGKRAVRSKSGVSRTAAVVAVPRTTTENVLVTLDANSEGTYKVTTPEGKKIGYVNAAQALHRYGVTVNPVKPVAKSFRVTVNYDDETGVATFDLPYRGSSTSNPTRPRAIKLSTGERRGARRAAGL